MSTFGPDKDALCKVNEMQQKPRALAIKRKGGATGRDSQAAVARDLGEIVGKDFYRSDDVNEGHYSKKRSDVADVDPKVRTSNLTGAGSQLTCPLLSFVTCLLTAISRAGDGAIPANPRQAPSQGRHRQTAQALRLPRHRGAPSGIRKSRISSLLSQSVLAKARVRHNR